MPYAVQVTYSDVAERYGAVSQLTNIVIKRRKSRCARDGKFTVSSNLFAPATFTRAVNVRPSVSVSLSGWDLVADGAALAPVLQCTVRSASGEPASFATGNLQIKESYPAAVIGATKPNPVNGVATFGASDLAAAPSTGNVWGRHDRTCYFNGTVAP